MIDEDALLRDAVFDELNGTVAILGAGFSNSAGVPLASEMSRFFVSYPPTRATVANLQMAISRHLLAYWKSIFDYRGGEEVPSFEDHFTLLDLNANAGHNLGPFYTPARLRAIRRLSIHRAFDIIDRYGESRAISDFLDLLACSRDTSIISLNWDITAESHLTRLSHAYCYDTPGRYVFGAPLDSGIPIIKLHGSANWHYCDSCRLALFGRIDGFKTALHFLTFIEERDFVTLGDPPDEARRLMQRKRPNAVRCPRCQESRTSARVATFSYAKAFDFFLFHAAWNNALRRLMDAWQWIFIGYSLPEADFAFRHLLKTAELSSRYSGRKRIWIVTKDDTGQTQRRYKRFFGITDGWIHSEGFDDWAATRLTPTLRRGGLADTDDAL